MGTFLSPIGRRTGMWSAWALTFCLVGCGTTGGWVMNNSGMGYYQQGNYAMARHEFSQAVAMDPWNADYRHNLALALQKSGDPVHAERILRHNLNIDAMHQPTYHSLAKIMLDSGRQPEADELLMTWAGSQPYNADAHVELAWLQRQSGNVPAAEQSLRQALQIEPTNATAVAQLGELYQEAGEPQRAAGLYQQALALDYNQPEIQSKLATLTGAGPGVLPGTANPNPAANIALAAGSPLFGGPSLGAPSFGAPAYGGPNNGMMYAGPNFSPAGNMPSTFNVAGSSFGPPTGTYSPAPAHVSQMVPGQWYTVPPGWQPTGATVVQGSPTPIPEGSGSPINMLSSSPSISAPVTTTSSTVPTSTVPATTVPTSTTLPALPGVVTSVPASPTPVPVQSRPVTVVPAGASAPPATDASWQPAGLTVPTTTIYENVDPSQIPDIPVVEPQ